MIRLLNGLAALGVALMLVGLGQAGERVWQHQSRARLNVHLDLCDYRPHKIADVAWEMTRQGDVPACTSAALSAQLRAPQSEELTSCMEQYYPVPVCRRAP